MRRATELIAALFLFNFNPPALLADVTPPAGFVPLFDGKTLDGWKLVNAKDNFGVRSGLLIMNRGSGWLATERTFGDFELRVRYRFLTPGADSGVFIRSAIEGKNWTESGYQVQNMDDHSLGMIVGMGLKVKAEARPAVVKRVKKRAGEWMDLVIRVKGRHAEVELNGQRVADSDDIQRPDGHIGLQAEGGILEFQRIDIKGLLPDPVEQGPAQDPTEALGQFLKNQERITNDQERITKEAERAGAEHEAKLDKEIAAAQAELAREKKQLQDKLASHEKEIADLKKETESLRAELRELRKKLDEVVGKKP